MRFQDRTAVVTGGGNGIGRASALRLAEEGATVVILDRDGEAAGRAADSIAERSGRATGLQVDVAVDDEVEAAVTKIHERYGRVDVLVNNAGYLRPGTALTQSIDDWDRTFAVNVRAMFLLSRAVLPGMVDRGVGTIVNIASTAGLVGEADNIAYATSKGAVVNLTRQLAADFSRAGIRVNCVCPGWVPTGFNDPFLRDMSEEEVQAMVESQVPLGRQGTAEEIAAAVAFLASDDASFIVGQALGVDGGVTACR